MSSSVRAILVTANVGSIFEEPELLVPIWINEFLDTLSRSRPLFVALHLQEVGGKHFERSMRFVDDFVRTLLASDQLIDFPLVRVFLDEDFVAADKFTALGCLYFAHHSLRDVHIWDFNDQLFVRVIDKDIHSGNIEDVAIKEKSKFPQSFFPECQWSRKGFMRTRWRIEGVTLDLVNVHLFHDADNFVANSKFPSLYAQNRHKSLDYTLRRLETNESVPFFVFGDFNTRLDLQSVIHELTNEALPMKTFGRNGQRLEFRNDKEMVLAIEKKMFDYKDLDLFGRDRQRFLTLDKELDVFKDRIREPPIAFAPTYPFVEGSASGHHYMTTRCPAWCDRIVFNASAETLIQNSMQSLVYDSMGADNPMGDHKPVYLCCDWCLTDADRLPSATRSTRFVGVCGHVFRETSV